MGADGPVLSAIIMPKRGALAGFIALAAGVLGLFAFEDTLGSHRVPL